MDFDVIVIGGGAAGLGAARAAAGRGARTLLVSDGEIGGDCTFTGCVPSKALIEAAARGASFETAMRDVRAAVARIAATEDASALRREGISVVRGAATFVSGQQIRVDGRKLRAGRYVIATGTRPAIPPIPGLAGDAPAILRRCRPTGVPYLTNENVFDLTEPPGALAVLGGGATGCELAQAFGRLGTRVTVIEARDRILPAEDPDVAVVIGRVFAEEGISVRTGTAVDRVEPCDAGVRLVPRHGTVIEADQLLVATGRRPSTDGLGLEAAGVRTDESGFVVTDSHLATTAPGVYAAGDVTGRYPFTHAAFAMGRIAARNALRRRGRRVARFDPTAVPRVTFTSPEVAHVGATAADVADRDDIRVAYLPMSEFDRAIVAGQTDGFVKLIAGRRRLLGTTGGGRLLGATIVGARAGEMIHEPTLAIATGMFTGRLAQTTHAYPTWSLAVQYAAAQFFMPMGGRSARRN